MFFAQHLVTWKGKKANVILSVANEEVGLGQAGLQRLNYRALLQKSDLEGIVEQEIVAIKGRKQDSHDGNYKVRQIIQSGEIKSLILYKI